AALQRDQSVGIGGAAGKAVGNAMAGFVDNDVFVQIPAPLRCRAREQKHLHPRGGTVWRRREIGVICPRTVLGIGLYAVVGQAAVAVVIDLEVARRLSKAVLVVNVVDDVVEDEQIHLGDVLVLQHGGLLRGIESKPAEIKAGSAVGTDWRAVGDVVGIPVEMGIDVGAPRVGEFRTGDAVGVMPAERRSGGIGRIRAEREGAILRALVGERNEVVGGVLDPIVQGYEAAGWGWG